MEAMKMALQPVAERTGIAFGNCCAVGTHAPYWPPPLGLSRGRRA
jgi:hypothetical protein